MILYSSNANTDFLLTKLGIDKVNGRLKLLDLVDHTPIYPLVSALSNKQSSSTTGMYVQLMQRLNEKNFLPESVHLYLDPVLEQVMANDTYKQNLKHLGRKGGSTAFLLTEAMYATDYCGNKLALAFFANDLTMLEQEKLALNLRPYYEDLMRELGMLPEKGL